MRHPVAELIAQRVLSSSRPLSRDDNARLSLVVEGGGMRGIVSSGMCGALELLGARDAFDAVYGTSAGAFNAAYFVAGQSNYSSTIYFEDINNTTFIHLKRLWSMRRPVMNLNFLVEDIVGAAKELDTQSIVSPDIPVTFPATSARTGSLTRLSNFEDRRQVLSALKASSTIPLIAGAPVDIDGEPYFDGGLLEPIPFRSALKDRPTHILVLLTRPKGSTRDATSWPLKRYLELRLWRYPAIRRLLRVGDVSYTTDLDELTELTRGTTEGPSVLIVRPLEPEIDRLECDPTTLKRGAVSGRQSLLDQFASRRLPPQREFSLLDSGRLREQAPLENWLRP